MKDDLHHIAGAIGYMEAHLKDKLTLSAMAAEGGFSKYHFTRLFSQYTGQSPYEYYRARKLTAAIETLQRTKARVIDVAYEFGFSSPEAFTRACSTVFGQSASQLKKAILEGSFEGVAPISEGYLWFMNQYDKVPEMVVLEALTLMGVGYFTETLEEGIHLKTGDDDQYFARGSKAPLMKITWMERQARGFMNFIGQRRTGDGVDMMLTKTLPKLSWLVFDYHLTKEECLYLESYIYDRYLPEKGYELLLPLRMEVFEPHGRNHLYLPVSPL